MKAYQSKIAVEFLKNEKESRKLLRKLIQSRKHKVQLIVAGVTYTCEQI
jgi:hypothetical protein